MKVIIGILVAVLLLTFFGCDLMTDRDQPVAKQAKGNELVINEVFNINPDKYYAYSWVEIFNPTEQDKSWFYLEFPAQGWVAGENGTICKTTETGSIWNATPTPVVPTFVSLDYFSSDTVFATGTGGKVYRSGDKGVTWQDLRVDTVTTKNLNSISVLKVYESPSNKVIYTCGDSGTILRSIDRGAKFTRQNSNRKERLNKIQLMSQTAIFIAGDSVLLNWNNTKRTWDSLVTPYRTKYNDVHYISLTTGRYVGNDGTILFTSTGGTLLEKETTPVTSNLNSLSFLPQGRAWAVGDNGVILRAEGAVSSTWARLNSGTTAKLNYVEFVDTSRGFVLGDGGLILYTKDGGLTWERQQSNTTSNLRTGSFLPFLESVLNIYVIQVKAQRRHIYWERPFPPAPDFITRVDTGNLVFVDQQNRSVSPGGFVVLTSDENKFTNHTLTGPSKKTLIHNTLAGVFDTERFDSIYFKSLLGDFSLARWNLLAGSEVRLIKFFMKYNSQNQIIGFDSRTIDVVRFGDFNLSVDYPNNKPAPAIPEWWSLARYADMVTTDLNTFSSDKYFYLTSSPVPAWVSQQRSK